MFMDNYLNWRASRLLVYRMVMTNDEVRARHLMKWVHRTVSQETRTHQ